MMGALLLIPTEPRKPRRMIYLSTAPTVKQIRSLLGVKPEGTYELVPEFNCIQHDEFLGRMNGEPLVAKTHLAPCIVYCRDTFEAKLDEEPRNQWGNILWSMSLARQYGEDNPGASNPEMTIKGPVLVITGDEEFLDAL